MSQEYWLPKTNYVWPHEHTEGAPVAPFPIIYQKYALHTARKMVGYVESVRNLPQGALSAAAAGSHYVFWTELVKFGSKSKTYYNHIKSYPLWLHRDLLAVWSEPACWQTRGRKNKLSIEGRLALSIIEAKIAGAVPVERNVLQGY